MHPSGKVSIQSNRTKSDPLYFKPMEFHTAPISYNRQAAEASPRRTLETILNILYLCLATACVVSQLVYVLHNAEAAAYISLVMVAIQALGYSISLTTGTEHYFAIQKGPSPLFGVLINVILLLACISTIGLFQIVWKSRLRVAQIRSEKRVLISCAVIYAICFLTEIYVGIVKARYITAREIDSPFYCYKRMSGLMKLRDVVRPYVGLIQDLFLLPQVVWISEWKYRGESPRKVYYVGLSALCFSPQIYNYINSEAPVEYDCHSQRGNIRAGSVVALVLAVVVYFRQTRLKKKR
ncbi:hypothetical protein SUGI_0607280, partial [Cryptomeria japonica]